MSNETTHGPYLGISQDKCDAVLKNAEKNQQERERERERIVITVKKICRANFYTK